MTGDVYWKFIRRRDWLKTGRHAAPLGYFQLKIGWQVALTAKMVLHGSFAKGQQSVHGSRGKIRFIEPFRGNVNSPEMQPAHGRCQHG